MCKMLFLYRFYLCHQTRYTIIIQHCEAASEATVDTVCDSTQDGGASVNSEACAGVASSRELNVIFSVSSMRQISSLGIPTP